MSSFCFPLLLLASLSGAAAAADDDDELGHTIMNRVNPKLERPLATVVDHIADDDGSRIDGSVICTLGSIASDDDDGRSYTPAYQPQTPTDKETTARAELARHMLRVKEYIEEPVMLDTVPRVKSSAAAEYAVTQFTQAS